MEVGIRCLPSPRCRCLQSESMGCPSSCSLFQGTTGSNPRHVHPSSPPRCQQERVRGMATDPPGIVPRPAYGGRCLSRGHRITPGCANIPDSQMPTVWITSGPPRKSWPTLSKEFRPPSTSFSNQ